MTPQPILAVIALSDSFSALWAEIATECGLRLVILAADAEPPPHPVATLIAAGGKEEDALDVLVARRAIAGGLVYVVGARTSHRFGVEAMRRGATDYFALPDDVDLLRRTMRARGEAARERSRGSGTERPAGDVFHELLGDSPALRVVLDKAARVLGHADVTVLIGGETGTGKELLARALHRGGPRRDEPFVAVNCAAIPAQLLESELFGHERGAFTDAYRSKPGLFEEADGGTLFLDEVGHLPLALQGKLLRALDEHTIRRVGATQERRVNVRIVAATHVDLGEAVRRGEFREDLFYRLNVVAMALPPLRERGDDIVLLARAFAESLAARYHLPKPDVSAAVRDALRRHSWPGNVRELRHAVERALLLSSPGTLDPAELVPAAAGRPGGAADAAAPARIGEILAAAVEAALARHGGNKSAAARELGISRARLQRVLDQEVDP